MGASAHRVYFVHGTSPMAVTALPAVTESSQAVIETRARASLAHPPRVKPARIRRERPATLRPGTRVGPWRVEGELGRGGMASVYAVTHTQFGKRAALKIAHLAVLAELPRETFLREARVVHLVAHPGAADVFATGSYDTRPYLVMERLAGVTLGQRVDAGTLDRSEAMATLRELCDIIAGAHAAGVVHRDLKLDNVFIETTPAGNRRVRLLDWGVARILSEADPLRGMVAGTLTYVAPEQILGDDISPASDIYSLGVLAYHVLLGAPPFTADSDLALVRKHLHDTPPGPATLWPEVPPALASLLFAMLAKDPAQRPTLDEVMRVLAAAQARPPARRRSWIAAAAAAVAGALGAFVM